MNYNEWFARIQKDPLEIKNVPADMLTQEMYIEAIRSAQFEGKDLEEFIEENIPDEARTDLVYEEIVTKDPELIKLVPPKMLTDRICKIAGETMKSLSEGMEQDSILPKEGEVADIGGNGRETLESILPEEGEAADIGDNDRETIDSILPKEGEAADIGDNDRETIDSILPKEGEVTDIGDSDRDSTDGIALKISKRDEYVKKIEGKMQLVANQREQIASKKKEISLSKSANLEVEKNGRDR